MSDEEKRPNEIGGDEEKRVIGDVGEVGGDIVMGDKVGGDKVEGNKISVEGGGIAIGGSAHIENSTVAGRDVNIANRDQYNINNVGPGSAIGPGAEVYAGNIAGGDIIYGGVNTNLTEIGELKAALGFLRDSVEDLPDSERKGQARLYVGKLEKALKLEGPEGAELDSPAFQKAADWLLDNVPELADDLLDLLGLPVIGKIAKVAGGAFADWLRKRISR